jgi:hypothetical protein
MFWLRHDKGGMVGFAFRDKRGDQVQQIHCCDISLADWVHRCMDKKRKIERPQSVGP